jgi:plastocyanin
MRKLLAALAIAAVAGASAGTALAATRTAKVGDNYFVRDGKPPTIRVAKGTKLRFRWTGAAPHNVAVTSGPVKFHSKVMAKGTYVRKLTKAGTYKLLCQVHPAEMRLTVKVR